MGEHPEPALRIGFDITKTQVVLRCSHEFQPALARLTPRFPEGRMQEPSTAVVPLEGFLGSLEQLAAWPEPEGVVWEQDLTELVGGVLDDADTVRRQLDGLASGAADVVADDVVELLGPDWSAELTSFQRRDIARLLSMRHGANFSVPGAGKTRVALAVYAAMRACGDVRRMLIVSPKSAYESWTYESAYCFEGSVETQVMERGPEAGTEILIVNYERLGRSVAGIAAWLEAAPSMIVLDEAHRMKLGTRGTYGNACMALGPLSRRRLILTGTPAPNGARDMENLLSFVWPGHGRRAVHEAVNGGDLAYASKVLRPLYTRTTKQELGLPPVDVSIRYVDLPSLHREIYDALVGRYSTRATIERTGFDALGRAVFRLLMAATSPALLAEGTTRYEALPYDVPPLEVPESDSLFALLKRLPYYETPPKYAEAKEIVSANARQGRKTLVWASFVRSLTTMEAAYSEFQPAIVHGGSIDREEQIRRFREDPNCMVLVSNPATLGEGISLHHSCHDAVYIDRDFQAGRFLQSLDRIHRLGLAPDTQTTVTVLAARGTIDEVVTERLRTKLDFMGRILDDPAVQQLADLQEDSLVPAGMDTADLEAVLRHIGVG